MENGILNHVDGIVWFFINPSFSHESVKINSWKRFAICYSDRQLKSIYISYVPYITSNTWYEIWLMYNQDSIYRLKKIN